MRNNKKSKIIGLSTTAIILAFFVIVPSAMLLFDMMAGIGKQYMYGNPIGYSFHIFFLFLYGFIPSTLSIIFSFIAFSKYHKNKRPFSTSIKILVLSALSISIFNFTLMVADLLLSKYVFK